MCEGRGSGPGPEREAAITDTIIALLDGSIYSRSVCDNAAWIAAGTGATVRLLHVLGRREAPAADLSGALALGARTALLQELSALDAERARLARVRGRANLEDGQAILAQAGIARTATVRSGGLVETVAEAEREAGLVVIGKRGEAADFARLHLGSNLEGIVRAATRPVFVAARAFRPVAKLLVAYDGGPSARRALDHVGRSPLFRGLDIRVLTVGPDSAELRRGLDEAQATLASAGHDAAVDLVPGQPEDAIADTVERDGIDLLVMGAYGHSRIRSMTIGSTTGEMIRRCRIPVLLFR